MSKLSELTELLKDSYVLRSDGLRDYYAVRCSDGLRDYYAAKAAINAGRKRDFNARFNAIRAALKNHRVTVLYDGQGCILVFCSDTGGKFWFAAKERAAQGKLPWRRKR